MCEGCRKMVASMKPAIRENVEEIAARMLDRGREANKTMQVPQGDHDFSALMTLAYLVGFLGENLAMTEEKRDELRMQLYSATLTGAEAGHVMRCSKNSLN